MLQRGAIRSQMAQRTQKGLGRPALLLPGPPRLYSSPHPGLGAGLAGSEVERHLLCPQGARGYWDALLSGKATGRLVQAHSAIPGTPRAQHTLVCVCGGSLCRDTE